MEERGRGNYLGADAALDFDDLCRCGVICTCGGDGWGEEYELDDEERYATLQAEHLAAADLRAADRG